MQLVNLSKTYRLKGQEVQALKGVSFDLPDKGMVFVLGKSGCGKSTLLNVLSGMDNFDGGDIVFKGKSLKNFSPKELDGYRNACCGFIFQEYNLIPELNVRDNIALSLQLQGKKDVEKRIADALKRVDLEGYEDRKVNELSGGQKQRVTIARAIIKDPEIIFADEPSGALDSKTGESVFKLLKELSEDKLVIIVSHDRESAEKYADRIIELSDGEVKSDTDSEYKEKAAVESPYQSKRSQLPVKTAIKIGSSNFKHHPIRLIATILLAVFSFTFFGLALSIVTLNKVDPLVDALYECDTDYILIKKYNSTIEKEYDVESKYGSSSGGGTNIWEKLVFFKFYTTRLDSISFTQRDVEKFSELGGGTAAMVYFSSLSEMARIEPNGKQISDEDLMMTRTSGYMSITDEIIKEHGFTLYGRLPVRNDEIVVNEHIYNICKIQGLRVGNTVYPINTPEDLIGKIFHYQVITGVLDTGCSKECYSNNHPLKLKYTVIGSVVSVEPDNYPEFFSPESDCVFHNKLYKSERYMLSTFRQISTEYGNGSRANIHDSPSYLLVSLPKEKKDLKRLINYIASINNQGYNDKTGICYRLKPWYTYDYWISDDERTNYCETLYWYDAMVERGITMYSVFSVYIGILFFIFTLILIINFITTSIIGQIKQIGIISASGCGFKDIFKIYFLNALIVSGIICALTLLSTGVTIKILNSIGWQIIPSFLSGKHFKMISLNLVTIAAIISISIAVALIGTVVSLRKVRKLSPAEIIRQGSIK